MNKIPALAIALATVAFACTPEADDPEYAVTPSIHPELAAHTRHFAPTVYRIGDNVYSAVGWNLGNVVMIEGDDGIIIVDTGSNLNGGRAALKALRAYSKKPVRAVVYTHFHPDHWGGVKAFAGEADVAAGKIRIFAHRTLLENVVRQGGVLGPILAMRTAYSFGFVLPPADREGMNDGIGPLALENGGPGTFIAPTDTFADSLDVTIAGVRLHMVHVPSEAPDEIAVYLPDHDILLSGEAIQGPTLPNIHTLRGTRFRDPLQWYRSIDVLRSFSAGDLVPAHGQPVHGRDRVEEVLRMTRDGIQFIHDQTVRHMNRGLTPDELANTVVLPPHLAEYKPYLRQYYGTVKHAVRQIYNGYLGWFGGDPVDLDPVPRREAARRYVALMGGRDIVFEAARKAYHAGDAQWAAELATHLVRIKHDDRAARVLKAAALRRLGYASMNTNWRHWYLSSATELEGDVDAVATLEALAAVFASPDIVAQWPLERVVNGLSFRLRAEKTNDLYMVAGFRVSDTSEVLGIEIRRGVAQFHAVLTKDADFIISAPRLALIGLVSDRLDLGVATVSGIVDVEGDSEAAKRFFTLFDPPIQAIALTVR